MRYIRNQSVLNKSTTCVIIFFRILRNFHMMKNHAAWFREQENLVEGLRSACLKYCASKPAFIR